MTTALVEILHNGLRAWAKGVTFTVKNQPYGAYLVKYESTMQENIRGRYN